MNDQFSTLLDECVQIFLTDTNQYLALTDSDAKIRAQFLQAFAQMPTFEHQETLISTIHHTKDIEKILDTVGQKNIAIYFLDIPTHLPFWEIRTIIDQKMIDSKIVFTSDTAVDDESVTNFHIQYHDAPESPKMPPQEAPSMQENPTSSDHSRPTDTTTSPVDTETPRTTETLTPEARVALSFRDFTAKQGYSSDPAIFLAGDGDLGTLYDLFEEYVHLRQNPFMDHEKYQESLKNYCEQRLTPMLTDLFAKEHETFREFIRALALGIWELLKEDYLAGLLNISRRKVHKFINVLLKHQMIALVTPLYRNKDVELSRHNKVYFTDMLWYASVWGESYAIGEKRRGMVENFVFLELSRKINNTHSIHFWRKKSGTDVPFVLIDHATAKMTPISISLRATDTLPRSLKSFYAWYHEEIEYGMFLNETVSTTTQYQWRPLILLPYPVI